MKRTFKVFVVLLIFWLIFLNDYVFGKSKSGNKDKVRISYLSEKASMNPFSISWDTMISTKNETDIFTFDNKQVTWSAIIRGGMGKYDRKKYMVNWYSPDGSLYLGEHPKYIFMDCTALKAELPLDGNDVRGNSGVWKVEAVYNHQLIDEKYFYLGEDANFIVSEVEKKKIDSVLSRKEEVARDKEEAETILDNKLVEKVLSDKINEKKSRDVVSIRLKTSSEDYPPVVDEDGNTYVLVGASKMSFKYDFKAFFASTNRDLYFYLISPDNRLVQKIHRHFIMTDDTTFRIKKDVLQHMKRGEWKAILYVKDKKISDLKFNVVKTAEFNQKYDDYKARKEEARLEEEAEKQKVHPAQRGGKPISRLQIKNGSTDVAIKDKWGEPDKVLKIDDRRYLWIYWTPGADDAYSSSRSASIGAQGNLVGALVYALVSYSVDAMLAYGKIVILYFEDDIVRGATRKDSVAYADLKDLNLKKLKYTLKDLNISVEK